MEVKLNNIGYKYNLNTKLEYEVLKNINISFKKNKINAIISNSGNGKTTLLKIIAGLLSPVNGHVDFIKKNNEKIPTIGLIFKNPEDQFFHLTVKQELEFAIKNLPLKKRLEKIVKCLKSVGLDETYLKKDPFKLSKGEMKKIALACVLVNDPKVILLDEPTIGLDDMSKDNLIKLMRNLKTKNKIIIITGRDTDFINKIAEYISVVDKGEIIMEGNKDEGFKYDILPKLNIKIPKIIEFSKIASNSGIKLDYHDDIKDLMKDIYRNVTK